MEERQENETKNKRCSQCTFFDNYYTKGYCHFVKEKNGYCRRLNKQMKREETCSGWRSKYLNKARRAKASMRALDEILLHLNEIRQIIAEDAEIEKD